MNNPFIADQTFKGQDFTKTRLQKANMKTVFSKAVIFPMDMWTIRILWNVNSLNATSATPT